MGSTAPSFGAWFVAIAFLAVLAGGAYYLVRIVRQGQGRMGETAGMHVLGRLPLSMNQSLVLVSLAGQVLLLGVGQRVELLWRIDDPAALDLRTPPPEVSPLAERLPEADFRGFLEESLRRVREARSLHRDQGSGRA